MLKEIIDRQLRGENVDARVIQDEVIKKEGKRYTLEEIRACIDYCKGDK